MKMNLWMLAATVAILGTSVPALGDNGAAPPPPMLPPLPPGIQLSESQQKAAVQIHQRLESTVKSIHQDARSTALATLSDPQRALLASVVGNLAIAPTPDVDAAVAQIDAALSAPQVQQLTKIANDLDARMRSTMESSRTQFEQLLTPEQRNALPQRSPGGVGFVGPVMVGPGPGGPPPGGPKADVFFIMHQGSQGNAFDAGRFLLTLGLGPIALAP